MLSDFKSARVSPDERIVFGRIFVSWQDGKKYSDYIKACLKVLPDGVEKCGGVKHLDDYVRQAEFAEYSDYVVAKIPVGSKVRLSQLQYRYGYPFTLKVANGMEVEVLDDKEATYFGDMYVTLAHTDPYTSKPTSVVVKNNIAQAQKQFENLTGRKLDAGFSPIANRYEGTISRPTYGYTTQFIITSY